MILILMSLAIAEPRFEKLEAGEEASFSGRLLNTEALATMISQCEFNVEQCEIQNDLQCTLRVADKQYEYDILDAKYTALDYKYKNMMAIKDEELKVLRAQSRPQRSMWAFFGGFVIGTAASLTTYYAVNQIQE